MTDDNDSDDRDMGVEFGNIQSDLEREDYPLSNEQLLDRYGDRELETANETKRLREILGDLDDREYESADDVHQMILNMVGDEAVGQEGYSDRGVGSAADEDPESF